MVRRYGRSTPSSLLAVDIQEKPSPLAEYLFRRGPSKCLIDQSYDPDHRHVLEAFEHLSRRLTLEAYDKLEQLKQRGYSHEEAWNEAAVDLTKVSLCVGNGVRDGIQASRAHTRVFLARQFVESVNKIHELPLLTVMKDLLQLYLFYEVQECAGGLLEVDIPS